MAQAQVPARIGRYDIERILGEALRYYEIARLNGVEVTIARGR